MQASKPTLSFLLVFLRGRVSGREVNELKYIFNVNKADEATVKNAFKDLFIAKAEDMFNNLGQAKMQQLFGVDNISDFLDEIDDISSPIYDFIKVE